MADEAQLELQKHLRSAARSLRAAVDVCARVGRSRKPIQATEAHRAKELQRTIGRLLGGVESVGSLSPGYNRLDPDLAPEETKVPRARADREAKVKLRAKVGQGS